MTGPNHRNDLPVDVLQSRKIMSKEDTQRSGGLSDFVVPSVSGQTGHSAKPRSNKQCNKSQPPQGCTNNRARRAVRRGTVFKDENFEARMRNGHNGVVLL